MKIEELERLAVAATAAMISGQVEFSPEQITTIVKGFRAFYKDVLAEFIEQDKAERAPEEVCWCDGPEVCPEILRGEICRERRRKSGTGSIPPAGGTA